MENSVSRRLFSSEVNEIIEFIESGEEVSMDDVFNPDTPPALATLKETVFGSKLGIFRRFNLTYTEVIDASFLTDAVDEVTYVVSELRKLTSSQLNIFMLLVDRYFKGTKDFEPFIHANAFDINNVGATLKLVKDFKNGLTDCKSAYIHVKKREMETSELKEECPWFFKPLTRCPWTFKPLVKLHRLVADKLDTAPLSKKHFPIETCDVLAYHYTKDEKVRGLAHTQEYANVFYALYIKFIDSASKDEIESVENSMRTYLSGRYCLGNPLVHKLRDLALEEMPMSHSVYNFICITCEMRESAWHLHRQAPHATTLGILDSSKGTVKLTVEDVAKDRPVTEYPTKKRMTPMPDHGYVMTFSDGTPDDKMPLYPKPDVDVPEKHEVSIRQTPSQAEAFLVEVPPLDESDPKVAKMIDDIKNGAWGKHVQELDLMEIYRTLRTVETEASETRIKHALNAAAETMHKLAELNKSDK